ncbi:hypothetical protein EBR66_03350 [bacterium]|nr:hypothetical protein [bacterium]
MVRYYFWNGEFLNESEACESLIESVNEFEFYAHHLPFVQVVFQVFVWAETYNIFRVYGGRGGMMFVY